jgi:fibro-slime domain-containing protein
MANFKKSSTVLSSLVALGFAVSLLPAGAANAASISVTATNRDFSSSHADFEAFITTETGIVTTSLGLDGKPVYNVAAKGLTSLSSATTGQANFNQWYNDTPSINQTFTTSLIASEAVPGSGIFSYVNTSYFPVNGLGFGNEGNLTNFHFTTEINTEFTYTVGETFSFTGDDDVWVFINGELAIDLGGVHGPITGAVSLDTAAAALGITTGGTYDLDIFQAERHKDGSSFSFTTSIVLVDAPIAVPEPGTLLLLGLGPSGIGFMRRRKAA